MICCTGQLHSINLVFELSVGQRKTRQRKIKQRKNNLKFIRNWPEKWLFLMGGLASSSIFWDWHYDTRYELEILHQFGQRDKTKSQKVYREKLVGEPFWPPPFPPPILNKVKNVIMADVEVGKGHFLWFLLIYTGCQWRFASFSWKLQVLISVQ